MLPRFFIKDFRLLIIEIFLENLWEERLEEKLEELELL